MSHPASEPSPGRGVVVPEETAEELYEQAPCGYLSTLPDGTIVRVNDTFCAWTGYTKPELVQRRRFVDLLAPGGRIYHETHYAPLLAMQGSVRAIAAEVVRADGSRLPVLVNATVVRGPSGDPRVIRTSVFDATDRRSYEQELLRARQRAERSEERAQLLARTLQDSLLPPSLPDVPGVTLAAAYRPAGAGDEVGGDFYDVFTTADDVWTVVVGDVGGKGAQAATVTALARYTLRAVTTRAAGPAAALRDLNAVLLRDAPGRYCTVLSISVQRVDGGLQATVASGGHALPLRVSADRVVEVGRPGMLLGAFDDPEVHETPVTVADGDFLFAYTDGLPEGRRGGEFYGDARLAADLRGLRDRPFAHIPDEAVEGIVEWQGGRPRDDMAAVLVAPASTGVPQTTTDGVPSVLPPAPAG